MGEPHHDQQVDFRLRIPAEVRHQLDELFEDLGMTRTTGVVRIFTWFLSQPEQKQEAILRRRPGRK